MTYYAIAQDLPAGTFPGNLAALLVDKLYPNAHENGYDVYPWYARERYDSNPVFNDRMILKIEHQHRLSEISRISSDIFIVGNRVLDKCHELNVEMIDHQETDVLLPSGAILKGEYSAAIFRTIDVEEAADASSQLIYRNGHARRIKSLQVKNRFDKDLFAFRRMEGTSQALICSEAFRSVLENCASGIKFVDIRNAEWPRIKIV